ncbi:hypothetical protein LCGC14_2912210 [marine sediment metagenome]|uniref:Uncharacterized protein n=1 Tax=marine sediment metagenome TaxID=412755 RepID=A0A0F8XRB6_9ZZZZ
MKAGSRWVYSETDTEGAEQRVVVTVTRRTKKIANGVEARVVHDEVTEDGALVEDTFDWYAQDSAGNIWYLGEDTKEYEDEGEILSLDEQAEVPFGHFTDVLMTKDLNSLEPKVLEFKFYARGVGPVLALSVSGGSDREQLVSFSEAK